jgi:NTE family protein
MPFGSEPREKGIALSLSGGGFRAVLFHIGALWRLNELGTLPRLSRISSVSGGSIASGQLAARWQHLHFQSGVATNFDQQVVTPLRRFCSIGIDVEAVLTGAVDPFRSAGEVLAQAYRDHLGLGLSLQDLPAWPIFIFNATNYATGSGFRFSRPYAGDYRIGLIRKPQFDVATAVACSSAFPPLLAPVDLQITEPHAFERTEGADLWEQEEFRSRLRLADGGVYDNLALETVWDRFDTVLVSDAGKPFELDAGPFAFAPKQLFRVMDIALNQALALRKRMLMREYRSGDLQGAFWAINTPITDYDIEDALPVAPAKIAALSAIRTRLDAFSEQEQCELVNWGYAVADAALRAYAPDPVLQVRSGPRWPYPQWSLG